MIFDNKNFDNKNNKGRRQELTKLRYKQRLKRNQIPQEEDNPCFKLKSQAAICSCWMCSKSYKFWNRRQRAKNKQEFFKILKEELE